MSAKEAYASCTTAEIREISCFVKIIARRDPTQKLHEGEEIAGRSEEEL
jgi:hypothetical protein